MGNGLHRRTALAHAEAQLRRDTVLALLEEKPYATSELAEILGVESGMHQVLSAMAKTGTIVRLDAAQKWALPGQVTPAAKRVRSAPPATARNEVVFEPADPEDGALEDPNLASVDELLEQPRLRQKHERPSTLKLKPEDRGSWWITEPREGFSAKAKRHEERMRNSKAAKWVSGAVRE